MCDRCVIDTIKERLVSRRHLIKAVGAASATLAIGSQAQAANSFTTNTVLDLSYDLYGDFPTFDGGSNFVLARKLTYAKHRTNLNVVSMSEHIGTHLDAPLHFTESGQTVSEIPVTSLALPVVVVDIREKAANDADAQLTPDDLKAWMAIHGPLPRQCCVAMNSGWAARLSTAGAFRNADNKGQMHFPGFHAEAAQMLIEDGGVLGIAVDTLSLDHGASKDFATHFAWLPSNRWGIEALANLDQLPAKGATLVVGAIKFRGGTGAPCRVFAFV